MDIDLVGDVRIILIAVAAFRIKISLRHKWPSIVPVQRELRSIGIVREHLGVVRTCKGQLQCGFRLRVAVADGRYF